MNKILIPVDFEKQSLLAIEQSFSLAHTILAEITLLYVHEPSGIGVACRGEGGTREP